MSRATEIRKLKMKLRVALKANGHTPEQLRELMFVITEIKLKLDQGNYPACLIDPMERRCDVLRDIARKMTGDELYDEIKRLVMTVPEIANL
ncbi:MAG TPA: hypothetical protein VEK08_15985 [Planctomycetota bacterium]|nr:hypothetical protein [Planctomycetota bacterium]